MCSDVMNYQQKIENAGAYFRKDNLPGSDCYFFIVEARLCKCGGQWWTRTRNGYWTEAKLDKPEGK